MDIRLSSKPYAEVAGTVLFLALSDDSQSLPEPFSRAHAKRLCTTCWRVAHGQSVLGVGLGERLRLTREILRDAAGTAVRAIASEGWSSVVIELPAIWSQDDEVDAIVQGLLLGAYAFVKYKQDKPASTLDRVILSADSSSEPALRRAQELARATVLARNLCNEPPNLLRPSVLADFVSHHFSATSASVEVWDETQLVEAGMNGLVAVGKGSKHPPRFISIRYQTDDHAPYIALVGKGITFDTGGISLKSGRDLSSMRLDMAGAAAVIGAIAALVSLQARCNVIGLIASAENMPAAGSMLPGEIVMYKNGLTVQVGNTDAEGRLVLADALLYAAQEGATQIVDIATLTGSAASALGERYAAIFGDDPIVADLLRSGERSGDYVWRLPLVDEYECKLDSVYADLKNIGGTQAGAIMAALFLRRFVPNGVQWAHVDMAGPMEQEQTHGYRPQGATGFGARLLADYVLSVCDQASSASTAPEASI